MIIKTLIFASLIALIGCESPPPTKPVSSAKSEDKVEKVEKTKKVATELPSFRHNTSGRLVAIADVHGDLSALQKLLRAAKLTDESDIWIGGDATLVQTGDLLDRGPDERAVVDLMLRLAKEAEAAGGQIVQLNGNHEIMNVFGDLRYIVPKGFTDFNDIPGEVANAPAEVRGRVAAWRPGGPYARALAPGALIAAVNDSLFAHGGVSMVEVTYGIDTLNHEVREWMLGNRTTPPDALTSPNGPIWSRKVSEPSPSPAACAELSQVLDTLGLKRLVVGHTVQKGVNSACDGKVWRIDAGMSAHYGSNAQAIEIVGDSVNVILP